MDRQQHKAAAMVGGLKVEFKWDQQQNGRASEMFFFPFFFLKLYVCSSL